VRRWTCPIQPGSSSSGQTPLASTTAEMRLVARYQSHNTRPPELVFRALLGNGDSRELHLVRALSR
jgi:hypothetical protein